MYKYVCFLFPSGQRNNNKKEKKSAALFPLRRNNYDVEISYPMNRQTERKNYSCKSNTKGRKTKSIFTLDIVVLGVRVK